MRKFVTLFSLLTMTLLMTACQSTYYAAMEKVGVHKRDILTDRVEDTKTSQEQARETFKSALERYQSVVNFDGGDLEDMYEKTEQAYEQSQSAADNVHDHIAKVKDVAEALFDEWDDELDEYSNAQLRRASAQQLKETRQRYQRLVTAMEHAEQKMQPVLDALHDNALYLKHNLNAQAIGALQGEYKTIKTNVDALIKEMNQAIAESDAFLKHMEAQSKS